jgi:hypothetical protein
MHLTYCKRSNFNLRGSIPKRGVGLLAFCALGLSIAYFATDWVRTLGPPEMLSHLRVGKLSSESLVSSAAALLCFVAIFVFPAMSHPMRGELSRWIMRKRGA